MLPLRFIRENADLVKEGVFNKNENVDIQRILDLDEEVRAKIGRVEALRAQRNKVNRQISDLKKRNLDASQVILEMKTLSRTIRSLDQQLSTLKGSLEELLVWVPNLPHPSVPVGENGGGSVELRTWGDLPKFDFEPKSHLDIGKSLGILDFERASKISGSGFPLYSGLGATVERALINFMLDHHLGRGYTEVYPPFMTLREPMEATGQLPKLEEDMYHLDQEDMFLIPTAEVPLTNIHRDEILSEDDLPVEYVAFSPCFRREAGSYGRETRGLLRVHQFNKVELVKLVSPERSYDELESLTADAESVLQALDIPYRVVALCTEDLSFAASKCYDLEVWAPGEKRWLEVSSCSNFESFQARRANIRYRKKGGGVDFVHTLNGSGVATARLMVALLEIYQTEEETVMIPEVLRRYTGFSILK